MQSLSTLANKNEPANLAGEILRLESLVAERREELTDLQEEFHEFKTRYTQVVGSRLSELAEVEAAIREAEAQMFGAEAEAEDESDAIQDAAQTSEPVVVGGSFRKLFWSVARLFHPDHASDEKESRRRHAVMAEASRAYREGDAESLRALLGDEELQFFCTGTHAHEEAADLASRLVELKEELRTIEFGIKRLKQNGLYQLKLKVEEDAKGGPDPLAAQAERINRQIIKARRRLENLSS